MGDFRCCLSVPRSRVLAGSSLQPERAQSLTETGQATRSKAAQPMSGSNSKIKALAQIEPNARRARRRFHSSAADLCISMHDQLNLPLDCIWQADGLDRFRRSLHNTPATTAFTDVPCGVCPVRAVLGRADGLSCMCALVTGQVEGTAP